jgi:hypothetical protein
MNPCDLLTNGILCCVLSSVQKNEMQISEVINGYAQQNPYKVYGLDTKEAQTLL